MVSPLTRGLRLGALIAATGVRIIPAHAGFTTHRTRNRLRAADHPRSRGVYRRRWGRWWWCSGSSPLARGLPAARFARLVEQGIIPAHAGFTTHRTRNRLRAADHPRSRGVYLDEVDASALCTGSSPLARGLHHRQIEARKWRWIIPARAGFTLRTEIICRYSTDHPRSRGVYTVAGPRAESGGGSSPLARGLPRWFHTSSPQAVDHPRSRGVYWIPVQSSCAPAGSSPLARGLPHSASTAWTRSEDHPRSRGVYVLFSALEDQTGGSSPLARGLRRPRRPGQVLPRIIPARAGFTRRSARRSGRREDHPRSRGVYLPHHRAEAVARGSSPLARGLPHRARARDRTARIIPARAGFTAAPAAGGPVAGDHPRSRGVYSVRSTMQGPRRGSSPLARGLPGSLLATMRGVGIIPARAGFTRPRGSRIPRRRGSSPLARGLPELADHLRARGRIIPARAGFTRGCG